MADWYSRPVLFVSDIERSVAFYLGQLGFREDWRYDEAGDRRIVQVSRQECELILSSQWPDKVGGGLIFVSPDLDLLSATRSEFEARGVEVKDGRWGYPLMIVADPDGNELYFPYPSDDVGEQAA
jgi:catechol 2,3-dioxygenase-like lactoylglutathione lyase family enzyme